MSIGLVGKDKGRRLHLNRRSLHRSTGIRKFFSGDASRRKNLQKKQSLISRFGTYIKKCITNWEG
jgi:hypothetical protein